MRNTVRVAESRKAQMNLSTKQRGKSLPVGSTEVEGRLGTEPVTAKNATLLARCQKRMPPFKLSGALKEISLISLKSTHLYSHIPSEAVQTFQSDVPIVFCQFPLRG